MSSAPDLPAPPLSIAAKLQQRIAEQQAEQNKLRPASRTQHQQSQQTPSGKDAPASTPAGAAASQQQPTLKPSVQAQLKLPQPPRAVSGKPILRLKGTRVVFRRPADEKQMLYEGVVREFDEAGSTISVESGSTTFTGIPIEADPNSKDPAAGDESKHPVYATAWSGPADVLQTDDLVTVRYPDALSLLYALQQRFFAKRPYTWLTRDSLVYVNPFQQCPDVFAGGQPHPFSVAEQARSIIREDVCDVAAVITGQSGSGKSEAAKMILRHFAAATLAQQQQQQQQNQQTAASPSSSSAASSPPSSPTSAAAIAATTNDFVALIAAANPLLESFGNAVTAANANSSRFIRTTRITTDRKCRPRAAEIQVSLLETARLCGLRPAESSFHIFYAMLGGLPVADKVELELTDPTLFRCLVTQIDTSTVTASSASATVVQPNWLVAAPPHKLHAIVAAMKEVGLSERDVKLVFRMLAFVLHLLNVEFSGSTDAAMQAKVASPAARKALETAAKLLKVDAARLEESMTTTRFTDAATQQLVFRRLTVAAASASRDTIARNLYWSLFLWIVAKVNDSLNEKCLALRRKHGDAVDDDESSGGSNKYPSLLILDVFGFESMRNVPGGNEGGVAPPALAELNCHNGLEQLLINFVNEELQHLFTETSLIGFCDELTREGIVVSHGLGGSSSSSSGVSPGRPSAPASASSDGSEGGAAAAAAAATAVMTPAETMARELAASQNRTMDCLGRKTGGILATINDDAMLTNPAPAHVLQDRILALAAKNPTVIKKLRGVPDPEHPTFVVEHFACPVPYSTNGMAAKNKVSSAGLSMLLPLLTAFPEALELLRSAEQATRRGGAAVASATTFTKLLRDQVDALLTTLKASRCIWVRCIKPNGANTANVFDTRDVKRQLLTAGVLASAGVLAQGLSVRMPIRDFAMRFAAVLDKYPWRELEKLQHKKVCEAIGKKVALLMQKRQQREQQQQQQASSSPPRLSSQHQQQQQQQQQAPMQIGLTKVFLNTEAYEELTAATNERLAAYLTAVQQAGRAFRARLDVADLLRVAVRRRLAHELSLRIEEERSRREALEVERCLDEERSAAAMAAVRPRAAQLGREAGIALGQRTKQFLDTMHDELHRVCVDVALYDRLRKQREDELRDRKRIADAIAMNEEKKRGREERGANLLKFRAATPSTRRITADKEEQERRAQAEAEFKMRAQINRAHVEYGRRNTDAEVGLQKNNARVHATQQVGWLHQHLQRSWARLDHQAEIQRSRMAQERALPGYEHDAIRRHLERSESGRRAESIGSVATTIMSPPVESPVPRPAYMVPQQTGRY